MATQQNVDDLVSRFNVATSKLATILRDLRAQLASGGLTEAQETAALARLGGVADQLDAMGADPAQPVPPVVEPPVIPPATDPNT